LVRRFDQTQEDNVASLVQIRRESVTSNNDQLLLSYLSLLRRSKALSYAMIQDVTGRVLSHTNPAFVGQRLSDPLTLGALETATLLAPAGRIHRRRNRFVLADCPRDQTAGRRPGGLFPRHHGPAGGPNPAGRPPPDFNRHVFGHGVRRGAGGGIVACCSRNQSSCCESGAQIIGEGNLTHRIQITTRDELGELAREFNVMAAKLQELDQLKQDFVSNVTHELRSPLTSLRGYVELLLREGAGPINEEQREFLIVIKNNSVRLARFIDNLSGRGQN
jgi:hypothetical protein